MIHSVTKESVVVEETQEGLLCVRIFNYGDAALLDDRLTEDFDVSPVFRCVEEKEEGKAEVFVFTFPEAKSRSAMQVIIDQIQ